MKKNTIRLIALAAIPVSYMLVKKNFNKQAPMTATNLTKNEVVTKIDVENDEYSKTIMIPRDSMYIDDLPDMYYLTKDNINYILCQKRVASKVNMDTNEIWKVEVYIDVDKDEVVINPSQYTILSTEEFNKLYGIDNVKAMKLTIVK